MRTVLLRLLAPLLLCTGACAPLPVHRNAATPVVLVSIDALRADVVGSGRMPTLDRLAQQGVQADWMTPSYPTLTFPNHYTLVTGLRPDHHGIVHNNMRDATLGEFVSKGPSAMDPRWWGGEPIWATLQRHGGRAATMFWPGSGAPIGGRQPRDWRPFDPQVPAAARVDQVLAWLERPAATRPGLVTLYFDQVDHAAHDHGPFSDGAQAAMAEVDAALARLLAGLQARDLRNRVDLVVVSDHGMAEVAAGHAAFLDDSIDAGAIDEVTRGQVVGLSARPGRERDVDAALLGRHDHYACWRKQDMPAQWRYGQHPRVPPITCQADVGWDLGLHADGLTAPHARGDHGYPPEEPAMRAVFVASGPDFARGVRLPPFDNVDVYPLLAHLLGIAPQPGDGTLAPLLPALAAGN